MKPETAGVGPQFRRLAQNAFALAAGGIVAQIAFVLLEVLVARGLGAEAYGIFVTAYAWTVLGSFLMDFGTPLWTIQEGSRHHDRLPELLGSGLTVNLVIFAVLYVSLVVVTGLVTPNPILSLLLIVLPYGLVLTMQNGLAAVYSSYQTMHVNALFQGLAPVAILAFYFVYSFHDLTLSDVALSYVVGGGVVTGIWFVMTLRKVRPRVDLGNIRLTLRSSYQYGLTGILFQIFYKTDIVILSLLAGAREAGLYAAAFKLVEVVFKVAVLLSRVFAPAVFKASQESARTFQVLASMMTRLLAISGLVAGVAAFVLADELMLLLFGEKYEASIPVLRILGGVMATMSIMISMQLLLSSIDLHFQRVASLAVTVVLHIALCASLVPRYGANGAAIATLASGILINMLYAYSASRRPGLRFVRWLLVPSLLAAGTALATRYLDVHGWITAACAVAVFVISLFLSGIVRTSELRFILSAMSGSGRPQPPIGDDAR